MILGPFIRNYPQFHDESGEGYKFIADMIIKLDKINPSVASTLASAYNDYSLLKENQKEYMKGALELVLAQNNLSKNTYEIIHKTYKG